MSMVPTSVSRIDEARQRERELRAAAEHRRRLHCQEPTPRNPRVDA
jgi:hypothetical protein